MFFRRKQRVQCWYCNTWLHLTSPASTQRTLARGKASAEVEGAVAVGASHEFWCGECGQITRKDEHGEIVSDEPAFFDSQLNDAAFAKRASPSRHRLPPTFPTVATTPFCRQCLANQSLQLYLLASYPSDSDAESDPDERDSFPPLDVYRESLDARYPLVCDECAPIVEGTIRERDYRIKAQALGWRLRESQKARERQQRVSEEKRKAEQSRWILEGWAWRLRGLLWAMTAVSTAGTCGCYLLGFGSESLLRERLYPFLRHTLLPLAVLSLLWSFWDPTWSRLRLERARGRNPTVQGRALYLTVQMLAYLVRLAATVVLQVRLPSKPHASHLATALLAATISSFVSALYLPRLKYPVPIRLASHRSAVHPSASASSGSSTPTTLPVRAGLVDPLEPLAHLSLSRPGSLLAPPSPPATPTGPQRRRYGSPASSPVGATTPPQRQAGVPRPRLPSWTFRPWRVRPNSAKPEASRAMEVEFVSASTEAEAGDNSMDWTPTPPAERTSSGDSFPSQKHITFARQRFVPPDTRTPTGLEGMFARVVAVRGEEAEDVEGSCDAADDSMQGVEMTRIDRGWWRGWPGNR